MSFGYKTQKKDDDKKFFWIRLMLDFFHTDTMDFLMSQKNGANYVSLYMMLLLMSANTGGKLQTEIGEMIVPIDVDKIVRDTKYFTKDTVIVGIELFKKLGLVYEDNNGSLVLPELDYLVGTSSGQTLRKTTALIDKEKEGGKVGGKVGGKNYQQSIEYRDKSIEFNNKDVKDERQNETMSRKDKINPLKETYYENKELQNIFIEFLELRTKLKAVNSERAINSLLKILEPHSDKVKIKMIEQSIISSWKSIYDLKNDYKKDDNKVRQGETNKMTDDYWLQFETK